MIVITIQHLIAEINLLIMVMIEEFIKDNNTGKTRLINKLGEDENTKGI